MGARTTCLIWWLFIFETSVCESNFILWWYVYVHFKIRIVFARRPDCMQLLASKNQAGIMKQIVDEQKIWAHGSNMNHKNAFFHPVVINHPVRSLSMPQQSVFDPMVQHPALQILKQWQQNHTCRQLMSLPGGAGGTSVSNRRSNGLGIPSWLVMNRNWHSPVMAKFKRKPRVLGGKNLFCCSRLSVGTAVGTAVGN